jgi:hypothetical protein
MDVSSLSNDELVLQVRTLAGRLAAGEAEQLALIGELDEREAWAVHGVRSCAHWLSWQLGWTSTTARERVRVARALRSLPLVARALAAAQVSYSQVRALTRVAEATTQASWLELARFCTGAQLEKAARGAQRARRPDRDPAERPVKPPARVDWDDDGDLVLTLRIPAPQAVCVLAALEQIQAAEQADRDAALEELVSQVVPGPASAEAPAAEGPDLAAVRAADPLQEYPYVEPPYPVALDGSGWRRTEEERAAEHAAIRAWERRRDEERAIRDAWNARREQLLLEAAAQRVPTGRATLADALVRAVLRPRDCPAVTVQLLEDPVSGWARTTHDELLPPAALDRVLETLPRKRTRRGPLAAANDRARHDLGRSSRVVSPALRRLLGAVDGERCRFPGCTHTRDLHAHHLTFWSDGGRTDLANLALLCGRHHRLLHQAGYVLTLDEHRTLHVTCPDGTPLAHHPSLPAASAEALPHAAPFKTGYQGDPFDLGYVVNVMTAHAA